MFSRREAIQSALTGLATFAASNIDNGKVDVNNEFVQLKEEQIVPQDTQLGLRQYMKKVAKKCPSAFRVLNDWYFERCNYLPEERKNTDLYYRTIQCCGTGFRELLYIAGAFENPLIISDCVADWHAFRFDYIDSRSLFPGFSDKYKMRGGFSYASSDELHKIDINPSKYGALIFAYVSSSDKITELIKIFEHQYLYNSNFGIFHIL